LLAYPEQYPSTLPNVICESMGEYLSMRADMGSLSPPPEGREEGRGRLRKVRESDEAGTESVVSH